MSMNSRDMNHSCGGCNNYRSSSTERPTQQEKLEEQKKDDEAEKLSAEDALARFHNLCGSIYIGKVDQNESERITKAMIRTSQQTYMAEEFTKIGKTLGV